MPRPVCITYDSTCDLTPRLLERFHIRTVPLTIQSGERIFLDDGAIPRRSCTPTTAGTVRCPRPRRSARRNSRRSSGISSRSRQSSMT